MQRITAIVGALVCALVCALVLPAGALAAQPMTTVTGTLTAIESSSFTIQTAGKRTGVVNALTATADAVTTRDYPYVWGGGHAAAGTASVGIKGPGYNGHRVGYDCSGSVAAVLAGAGLWPAGSPVPSDKGIIAQLLQEKLIARGPGQPPVEVTLYDDPGVHIFMNVNGHFFGTSDGGGGNPTGGPSWLEDGAPDAYSSAYMRYHIVSSVLKDQTTYGHSLTFQIDANTSIVDGFAPGDEVQVSYDKTHSGTMIARAVGYAGAIVTSGAVASIAADGSSFTIESADGNRLTFSTDGVSDLITGLQVGDSVQVIYTKAADGTLTARSMTITAMPVPSQATGTIIAIAADFSSFTVQTPDGQDLTFSTGGITNVIASFQIGDDVQVSYTQQPDGNLIAQQVAAAQPATSSGERP
ncbi:MAG: DUF5666 domain-containing protein [Solirubrobacteraceae bacterium]